MTLDGEMALAYARSRKAEYHTDDGWVRDPQSDLSRIVRQQTLMTEALDKALHEADNPVRLRELVDIGAANVTIDSGLTLGDVRQLADRFRDLDSDAFHTVALPVLPRPGDEDSTVVVDESAAEPILAVFRGLDPGEVEPGGHRGRRAQRHGGRPGPPAAGAGRRRDRRPRGARVRHRARRATPTGSTSTRPSLYPSGELAYGPAGGPPHHRRRGPARRTARWRRET